MLRNNHRLSVTQYLEKEQVEKWVHDGPTLDLINHADNFGRYIAELLKKTPERDKTKVGNEYIAKDETVTKSQIRQIFGKLKSIEAKGYNSTGQQTEFLMLKPLMAYASGRHNKTGLERLKERVVWGIDAVLSAPEGTKAQRFKNFCKLFEAILAYHKAHGGD
jgi:CRISPR-associated protein Csm2